MSEPAPVPTQAPPSSRSRASVRQLWVERLARFCASGLRPAEFCAAEGVSLPSFYSWKRRLATADLGPTAGDVAGDDPGPRLLPVRLASTSAPVELVLAGGTVLRVGPGCDLAFLRALIEALGDTPC
jgi:transposase